MSTSLIGATSTSPPAPALPELLLNELADLHALAHLDREDRPLPTLIYNAKRQLPDGSWARKDVFVNALTEELKPCVCCVLLHIRKTRRYATYSESAGLLVNCESEDLQEGLSADGELHNCAMCTYKSWGNGHGREAAPKCGIVYCLLGIDLDDGSPFIVRAKATSLRPVQRYLAKHFLGKLRLADGRYADLPLFVSKTKLSLIMPSGTYAILQMDDLGVCNESEIRQYKALYEALRGLRMIDEEEQESDS